VIYVTGRNRKEKPPSPLGLIWALPRQMYHLLTTLYKNKIAAKVIENTNLTNATFEPNYVQSSVTQIVYSCLFKNEILMNMLEESSSHGLLCLNDLAEYVALQVHNSLFSEDLSSLVETTKNEAHYQS
ncbi:secreted effector protein SifB, partial [Salmonella enterica subsp. enterica serovar Heidelberg str. 579083-10]